MPNINRWGPAVWNLFHCMTINLKDQHFDNAKNLLYKIITNICFNLPCPDCKEHASKIIKNINVNSFKTKNDFVIFIFQFHNLVNLKTNKPVLKHDILKQYENMNFINVINEFYIVFNQKYNNQNLIMASFNKNTMLKSFKTDIILFLKYC